MKQYQGGVRLWRIWREKNGLLYPLTRDDVWKKNPHGATKCDQEPRMGTGAGFYGFFDLQEMKNQESQHLGYARDGTQYGDYHFVIGSFIAFGRMVKGTLGCRAEYAKPEYLILPPNNEDFAIQLMTVAQEYGMKPIQSSQARELKTGLVPYVKPRATQPVDPEGPRSANW